MTASVNTLMLRSCCAPCSLKLPKLGNILSSLKLHKPLFIHHKRYLSPFSFFQCMLTSIDNHLVHYNGYTPLKAILFGRKREKNRSDGTRQNMLEVCKTILSACSNQPLGLGISRTFNQEVFCLREISPYLFFRGFLLDVLERPSCHPYYFWGQSAA